LRHGASRARCRRHQLTRAHLTDFAALMVRRKASARPPPPSYRDIEPETRSARTQPPNRLAQAHTRASPNTFQRQIGSLQRRLGDTRARPRPLGRWAYKITAADVGRLRLLRFQLRLCFERITNFF